jgi:hypothetical protein
MGAPGAVYDSIIAGIKAHYETTDNGAVNRFLGIRIQLSPGQLLQMDQTEYVEEVAERFKDHWTIFKDDEIQTPLPPDAYNVALNPWTPPIDSNQAAWFKGFPYRAEYPAQPRSCGHFLCPMESETDLRRLFCIMSPNELCCTYYLNNLLGLPITRRIPLFSDAEAARSAALNPAHHQRTMHVQLKYRFIRQFCDDDDDSEMAFISMERLPALFMILDILTKITPRAHEPAALQICSYGKLSSEKTRSLQIRR